MTCNHMLANDYSMEYNKHQKGADEHGKYIGSVSHGGYKQNQGDADLRIVGYRFAHIYAYVYLQIDSGKRYSFQHEAE